MVLRPENKIFAIISNTEIKSGITFTVCTSELVSGDLVAYSKNYNKYLQIKFKRKKKKNE